MTPRAVLLALLVAATLAPLASAQDETSPGEPEPTVNESDFDTGAPASDERYLDEGADGGAGADSIEPDPAVSEGDFDVSAPRADESYLDAAAAEGDAPAAGSDVPAPGLLAGLAALAVAALVATRRA